jgi:hypothetical protein
MLRAVIGIALIVRVWLVLLLLTLVALALALPVENAQPLLVNKVKENFVLFSTFAFASQELGY